MTPGRFTVALDDYAVLQAVRMIGLRVRPDDPLGLTQRQFDAADRPAGLPRAWRIAERFACTWSYVVELALAANVPQARRLARLTRRPAAGKGIAKALAPAARLVAQQLEVDTLRPHEYQLQRDRVVAKDRAAWRHGGAGERALPSVSALGAAKGWDWDAVLEASELRPRQHAGAPSGAHPRHVIERFIEDLSVAPTQRALAVYCRLRGFPLANTDRWGGITTLVNEARAERATRGLATPPAPYGFVRRVRERLEVAGLLGEDVDAPDQEAAGADDLETTATHRRHVGWTLAECKQGLITILEELPDGKKLDQRTHRQHATGRNDLPSQATTANVARHHHTTFTALRDAAIAAHLAGPDAVARWLVDDDAEEKDARRLNDRFRDWTTERIVALLAGILVDAGDADAPLTYKSYQRVRMASDQTTPSLSHLTRMASIEGTSWRALLQAARVCARAQLETGG